MDAIHNHPEPQLVSSAVQIHPLSGISAQLVQDFILRENLAHHITKGIAERNFGAKGSGLYGTFTVTHDISVLSKAQIFSAPGKSCRVFARFSGFTGEKGTADATRDLRGFALRFYTEQGNWDIAGSNLPVFAVKDPEKFPALMLAQSRDVTTNLKSITAMWDFWSLNPESLHYLLMLMSDRGNPGSYRHMHGYGNHTFSMVNDTVQRVWVKFHFRSQQVIRNLSNSEANEMTVRSPDFFQEDLCHSLQSGHIPKWKMYIQVMTEDQAKSFRWNPFDATKVWFHDEFPLQEVGILEFSEMPNDYFNHVEQAVFSPANLIEGIGLSPDRLLQARLFTYGDAQRHRVGLNATQLDVNRCPFPGAGQQTAGSAECRNLEPEMFAEYSRSENEDDHYTQPGLFYSKALKGVDRDSLVENIVNSMRQISGLRRAEIINRQLCHFFRANVELGMRIAAGLDVEIDAAMFTHGKEGPAQ